jgi:hypothetical protein
METDSGSEWARLRRLGYSDDKAREIIQGNTRKLIARINEEVGR